MKTNVKTVKFGGTSLCDADHFKLAAEIVKSDPARRYVVPSAPGKRFSGDTKVTDLLYECYRASREGDSAAFDSAYTEICSRFTQIIEGLGLSFDISGELDYIRQAILHRSGRDYAASRGEYLNGIIMAKYLGYDFIDAENVIFFRDNGTLDTDRTYEALGAELALHDRAVIPGFYGQMPNGTVKTFSRGGSDITGSIVAAASSSALYENWTDVSGFMMADPRIVKDACIISEITYRELRELSYMGATVLHEDAIFPVRSAGIPINIRNTLDPSAPGTMIVENAHSFDKTKIITGIAGKRGFSVITIEHHLMNSQIGFGRKVLETIEEHGLSFEHLPSGIDTMGVIVQTSELNEKRERIIQSLEHSVRPDSLSVEDNIALIAVVGRGMVKSKGVAARVFRSVSDAGVNIRMIDQGSSELNIILGVDGDDFERAVEAIYREFVN
ncbi:MAG: aspartate kinase [Clostridia bacterium]|nr:aspartate kinase [Clostridia bacterium]